MSQHTQSGSRCLSSFLSVISFDLYNSLSRLTEKCISLLTNEETHTHTQRNARVQSPEVAGLDVRALVSRFLLTLITAAHQPCPLRPQILCLTMTAPFPALLGFPGPLHEGKSVPFWDSQNMLSCIPDSDVCICMYVGATYACMFMLGTSRKHCGKDSNLCAL